MATADQVKALVKSHAEGDDERFYTVARQVAARASRAGHSTFAAELKELIESLSGRSQHGQRVLKITPLSKPRGELSGLLEVGYPSLSLRDLAFDEATRASLDKIRQEHQLGETLAEYGLRPASRLLFVGPPGTGKTSSATALAHDLGLPLFTIRLDGLITRYLGESAAKLRVIFDSIKVIPGIYLFDEVDALAGTRSFDNDVGEVRRILNSFLLMMEEPDLRGIVIAATNYASLLDHAVFRRFDMRITFPLPDATSRRNVIQNRLSRFDIENLNWYQVIMAAEGLSHSEITLAAEDAAKSAVMAGSQSVPSTLLLEALVSRKRLGATDIVN